MLFDENDNQYLAKYNQAPSSFAKENLIYITEAGHYRVVKHNMYQFKQQKDRMFLLYYVINGQGIVYYDDEYYALVPGDLFIFDCSKYFFISNNNWEIYYCFVCGEHIQSVMEHACSQAFVFDFRLKAQVESYFKHMMKIAQGQYFDELSASASILKLLSDIHNTTIEDLTLNDKRMVIREALIYIENNYNNAISLKDIAEHVNYSEFYFSRLFKTIIGDTPYNFLVNRRLSQAKMLLSTTHLSIQNIAENSGFVFESNFYSVFKKKFKMTPKQYRILNT